LAGTECPSPASSLGTLHLHLYFIIGPELEQLLVGASMPRRYRSSSLETENTIQGLNTYWKKFHAPSS
jgi:hypothetical protein